MDVKLEVRPGVEEENRFEAIYNQLRSELLEAPIIPPSRWQSIDVSDKPHMATLELLNISFEYGLTEDLDALRGDVKPNLPWADVHFETERVSGEPINPGESWKLWPGAESAGTMIREAQYDHSYAERYWPKFAGQTEGGRLEDGEGLLWRHGVRFQYGDLNDLVTLLVEQPNTRQAYLPVWFPEDLNAANKCLRVPCTLGYHFIQRNGKLYVNYYMRSCDFLRHFRDDVYLTARLLLWILSECRKRDKLWNMVKPAHLTMHITSLHIFKADQRRLQREADACSNR